MRSKQTNSGCSQKVGSWELDKGLERLYDLGMSSRVPITVCGVNGVVSDLLRGNQLMRSGQLEEAVAAYQNAIARYPSFHWSYSQLGEALEQLGRIEEAIAAFRQAILLEPTARWSYFYLGQLLARQKQWEAAIASYQKALELQLNLPQLFWGLGEATDALKRWSEAVTAYEKAVQLNPNSFSPHNLGRALYYRGQSLEEKGKWSEAVEQYRQALNLGFDQARVHQNLGKGLNQLELYEKAVVGWKQALESNPLLVEWQQQLEDELYQLGRTLPTESIEIWKIQVSQPDPQKLNQQLIASCLDSPKNHQIHCQSLLIRGWVLPKEQDVGNIKIIAKAAEHEKEGLLSVKRPDVITKILNVNPTESPLLCCGFSLEIEPAEKIELYISIEGDRYHWKTIESTPVPGEVIVKSQQIWRNWITNNIKEARVRQHLGTGLSQLSLYEEAVIELRKALELNPISVEIQQQLKSTLNHLGLPMDRNKIIIKELEFHQYLQEYLAGKSVAVVGNSPRLLEQKYGSCIDSHDLVIRFNDADLRGLEVHAGQKTSIRFILANFQNKPEKLSFFSSLEEDSIFITLKKNMNHLVLKNNMIVTDFFIHLRSFNIIDDILGTEYSQKKLPPVRTGLAVLLHLIHAGKDIKKISIFGMERQVRKEGSVHFYGKGGSMCGLNVSHYLNFHISLEEEMKIFNQILDKVDVICYEPKEI